MITSGVSSDKTSDAAVGKTKRSKNNFIAKKYIQVTCLCNRPKSSCYAGVSVSHSLTTLLSDG